MNTTPEKNGYETLRVSSQFLTDLNDAAKTLGLSRDELLNQSLALYLDWRIFDPLGKPLTEKEKSESIKKFAEDVFKPA